MKKFALFSITQILKNLSPIMTAIIAVMGATEYTKL